MMILLIETIKDMFFDINGLVAAEKRLINVVNLEKKGDHFSCLAASRSAQFLPHLCEAVRLVRRYYRISVRGVSASRK